MGKGKMMSYHFVPMTSRNALRHCLFLFGITVLVISLCSACIKPATIEIGMDSARVIQLMGEPEEIVYQDGKLLSPVADLADVDFSQHRVVFMYNDHTTQVWFQDNAVESMIENGVAVQLPEK